jgi:2-furoate---CoA ligase
MLDLGRTFLQSVDRAAGATALVDGALRLTWSEWARSIGGVQRGLAALGLRPGDHVLGVLQNRNEAATLHWACQFAGLVMTPLNWRAKPEELDHALRDSGARLLVYEAVSQEPVAQAVLARTVMRVAVGDVDSDDPRFAQVFAEPADPTPLARADDLSLMLYTSGTTGAPKGVPRRQRATATGNARWA